MTREEAIQDVCAKYLLCSHRCPLYDMKAVDKKEAYLCQSEETNLDIIDYILSKLGYSYDEIKNMSSITISEEELYNIFM